MQAISHAVSYENWRIPNVWQHGNLLVGRTFFHLWYNKVVG